MVRFLAFLKNYCIFITSSRNNDIPKLFLDNFYGKILCATLFYVLNKILAKSINTDTIRTPYSGKRCVLMINENTIITYSNLIK